MRRRVWASGAAALLALAVLAPAGAADEPVAPAAEGPFVKLPLQVTSTFQPIVGAFDCDEGSDEPPGPSSYEEAGVLWYAPGPDPDFLWTDLAASGGALTKTVQPLDIDGRYVPIVGDFDGDRCSDILWYGVGPRSDVLWWGGPTGFTPGVPITVKGAAYRPVGGYFGGAAPGVFWYTGNGADSVWRGTGDRAHPFVPAPVRQVISGLYHPVSFVDASNGLQQILWYAPGPTADSIWAFDDQGEVVSRVTTSLTGTYRTAACPAAVYLHGSGSAADHVLTTASSTEVQLSPLDITGSYLVAASDLTYRCTVVWHAPGTTPDAIWLPEEP